MVTMDIKKSNNCNGNYSIYLSFPFDESLVNQVRNLPERYWVKDTKQWEVGIKSLQTLLNVFRDHEIEVLCENGEILNPTPKNPVQTPVGFKFKTTPFNHQIEGFEYGLQYDRWLLGDEQGLGKTKQVIDISVAKKLQKGYKHCLIVCGVNGLKWNWLNEISTHSDESGHILGSKCKAGKITIGSTKDKLNDLINLPDSYFLITNVESLRDEGIANKVSELCKDGTIGIVAIDEIHKCKNPSSQQGKGILKVQPDCRIAMTGTPLMNTPMDLYIILKWLGYEKHSFFQFKNHYCVMGGFGGYQIVGYKYLEDLETQLNEIMLRRLKSDVLDLPEKLFIDEYVDMTPKQSIIYKEVTADIKSNIDNIKMANNPLAELIRMRQATGCTGILSTTINESAKLDRLEELVEESYDNGRKVVIFSNWTQMTDVIYDRLVGGERNYGVSVITGETKDEDRQSIVNKFQNTKDCNVLIGTIGAMGTGLTLTAGTVMIFTDHPWNRALYDQAVDRCHRIGQNENITVYNLLCKNTIDERIWDIVKKKGAMSDAIVDGQIGGDKQTLIDYLLG